MKTKHSYSLSVKGEGELFIVDNVVVTMGIYTNTIDEMS